VSVDVGALRERRTRTATRTASTSRIAPTAAALLALCAILLVGVVFVQIAVIRQNMDRSNLETRAGTVRAENRDLEAQLQQAQSSPRVAAQAVRLGMVLAPASMAHPLTGRPVNGG
jgi:cell division protein FtsL